MVASMSGTQRADVIIDVLPRVAYVNVSLLYR